MSHPLHKIVITSHTSRPASPAAWFEVEPGQGEGVLQGRTLRKFLRKEVDEVVKAAHNFLLPTADWFAGGDELEGTVLTV